MPGSLARLDEVCDAVVARIEELWTGRADADRVYADDAAEFVTTPDSDRGPVMQGREIVVVGVGWADPDGGDAADRSGDATDYEVEVYAAELYPGPGQPPREWVRERRKWVADVLEPLLDVRRTVLLRTAGDSTSGLYPVQPGRIGTATAEAELSGRKVFFAAASLTYRED